MNLFPSEAMSVVSARPTKARCRIYVPESRAEEARALLSGDFSADRADPGARRQRAAREAQATPNKPRPLRIRSPRPGENLGRSDHPKGLPPGVPPNVWEQWVESGIKVNARDNSKARTREGPAREEGLLRRIAVSDAVALEELYRLYSGRVLSFLRQLCRDAHVAEDLLQEVFMAVWRKPATFDASRGDVAGWLFTICRHKWIDCRRRRHPVAELDAMEYDPPAAERQPRPPDPARQSHAGPFRWRTRGA